MPEITVTLKNACSVGNVTRITGTCASIATGDTWSTGMNRVNQLLMEPFPVGGGATWTWTQSAGVITFTIVAGPILDVNLEAIGGT